MSSASLQFPARPADGHKGTFGRVLIVAGSRGMSGAASLSGVAALRGGAGLVFVALPSGIQNVVASYEPGYLTIGLPEDSLTGQLSEDSVADVLTLAETKDVVALGPGLGAGAGTRSLVQQLCLTYRRPMVIDADGLNVLAEQLRSGSLSDQNLSGPRVLTPHPGEFSRLSGLSIPEIEARRPEVAREFAARYGLVLLLKGPRTIITDGVEVAFNQTGNSGMATGGSGDVLTGLIAALLGQGLSPFNAARTGAYLHGLAGDIAAAELSEPGLIASDLPKYLPRAWMQSRPG